MSKKKKFFVVWEGKEPGIYRSWEECKKQIHGFEGAIFKGFETEKEAREAFLSPCWDYIGKTAKPHKPTQEEIEKYGLPNFESLSVDAACSGNPGVLEYRGVYSKTGEEVFRQGPFQEGTNNVGEFLALVHGLALLKQKNSEVPIYTDSKTAISWVKAKKHNSKLKKNYTNAVLFDLLARAEKWLAENEYTSRILKWETEVWGEIPADFGRK
ncbi:MAG: ribonuclease H family protein [Paludibacter sp.]|nr:ribonuclease H family protein [Paludibacter sp.]